VSPRRTPKRGRPRAVGGVVGQVLSELGLEAAASAYRLAQRWEAIVGPEVAARCRPLGMRGQVLEAEVDSSVWAQQLQLRRPEILAALRRELGEEAPSELRFRVGYTRRS